jgi:hypothetical protein
MTNEQDSEMNKDSCVQKVSAFMQQDDNTVESSNNFLSTKKTITRSMKLWHLTSTRISRTGTNTHTCLVPM